MTEQALPITVLRALARTRPVPRSGRLTTVFERHLRADAGFSSTLSRGGFLTGMSSVDEQFWLHGKERVQ